MKRDSEQYKSRETLPKSGRDGSVDMSLSSNSKTLGTQKRQWKAPADNSVAPKDKSSKVQQYENFANSGKFGGQPEPYEGGKAGK